MRLHNYASMFRAWMRGTGHKISVCFKDYNDPNWKGCIHIECSRCGMYFAATFRYVRGNSHMQPTRMRDMFLDGIFEDNNYWCNHVIIDTIHEL